MNTQVFQETGKELSIDLNELVSYVQKKLYEYDQNKNPSPNLYNPYKHPIIYVTKDGKFIKVPDDIVQKTIALWKERPSPEFISNSEYISTKKDHKKVSNILLLIIFICVVIYFYYTKVKKPISIENVKYVLKQ